MEKKHVLIVGLGLIGGSIALGIKKQHPTTEIIGLDVQKESLILGKNLGIIDTIGKTLQIEAPKADLIIFCCPVKQTEVLIQELANLPLKEDVLVTDTGSTKSSIVETANLLTRVGIRFVGGHPMAGSHKSGVIAAKVDLFENAYYLMTPVEDSTESQANVVELQSWLKGTNAKFMVLSPQEHDEITGMLSHLPHIIAAALVNETTGFTVEHPQAKRLAAGGFRDMTRIASSDPVMWTDILLTNKAVLLDLLASWKQSVTDMMGYLEEQDSSAIYHFFDEAKETRDAMPVHKDGALPAFFDLFVDIPDYPGIISEVTGYLAEDLISVINIKILETREDINGILQLTFQNQGDLDRAKECLKNKSSYRCYEK
ncbi:prephenate dehydrogenase [Carnobacterium gallinarum]|uniref:prephenate dehydrogenase n=1 Tax=Carnobacterium gallinarum TaxID=2749 RepID=UPI0005588F3A|nr:prephenate dehydrogenase [Carnobacterium gallinarum]